MFLGMCFAFFLPSFIHFEHDPPLSTPPLNCRSQNALRPGIQGGALQNDADIRAAGAVNASSMSSFLLFFFCLHVVLFLSIITRGREFTVAPAMDDIQEVLVNESVVKNNTEPLIIHSKSKKTTAA